MLAVSAAIAVHAALLFASLSSLSGSSVSSVSSGDDEDGAIQVTLAGKTGGRAAFTPSQPDQPVADLMSRVANASPSAPTSVQPKQMTPTSVPAKLDDLFPSVANGKANDASVGRGSARSDEGDKTADSRAARSNSQTDAGPLNPEGSSLWGQLGPCWKRMPGRATVPVTLEITLNRAGRLETPPKILRPVDIIANEARLASEAKALAAVAACGPYASRKLLEDRVVTKVTFR